MGDYANDVASPKLSEEARAARAPRPPEELVGALQDRIHPTSGRLLAAKPIATTRRNLMESATKGTLKRCFKT